MRDDEMVAEVLGQLTGDGYVETTHSGRINLTSQDEGLDFFEQTMQSVSAWRRGADPTATISIPPSTAPPWPVCSWTVWG